MSDFEVELTEGEEPTTPVAGPASPSSPSVSSGKKKESPPCPRWMHHRKDVYCKTCGKVGK